MSRAHPLRERALQLMRLGLATPGEIARACNLSINLVVSWRRRAAINTDNRRMVRVQRLMNKGR
jgi:DNA-binding CsgD family transcriptional regulator